MLHYPGPHQRVQIPLPNGREAEVAKGADIDLTAEEYGLTAKQVTDIEKGLVAQGWTQPDDAPRSRKSNSDKEG